MIAFVCCILQRNKTVANEKSEAEFLSFYGKKISLEIIAARYIDFSIFARAQKAGSLAQSVRASDS